MMMETAPLSFWIPFVLLSLVSLFVWQALYNIYFSPLSRVPGPLLAKITPKWLMLVDLAGNRTMTIHRLHQRYGPSVRVGPNEVSFSNPEVVKDIYGQQSTFMKAPIYDHLSLKPLGIFSMRDRTEHSERRRLMSHAFAQTNLYNSEPLINSTIDNLVNRIDKNIGSPQNVLLLFRLAAFDIVGELFLGQSFNGLRSTKPPQFLEDMDYFFILSGIESSFPAVNGLITRIPIPAVKYFLGARHRIIEYGKSSYERYIQQNGRNSGRKDLLTKILTSNVEEKSPLTDLETYTEVANLVFAGTDTTSTTLTYLFWELAKNPDWQERVYTELLSAVSSSGEFTYKDIADLRVLDAAVNEGLRLHPATPSSLQRETPIGGKLLNGFHIPAKTIVSMQCYTTQRDPESYCNPESFVPDRWLDAGGPTEAMKTLFLPFSRGTRACLGKNLAIMELKTITARLILRYSIKLAEGSTDSSMALTDHFLAMPRSGKCDLVFVRR